MDATTANWSVLNKFVSISKEPDFEPRGELANPDLVSLFAWSADEFEQRLQGSPIRHWT